MQDSGFFQIRNVDRLPAFFMNVVSAGNLWTFLSSNGGITAGRRSAEYALFPYYAEDQVLAGADHTGSKTLVRISGETLCWEPFSPRSEASFRLERNLYKSRTGNSVIFEETNLDWNLRFRWKWTAGDRFGFVREALLENLGGKPIQLEVLDGLQNIMPYGVPSKLQESSGCLVNAYKKSELESGTGLGMFCLSAIISDRAEPSEALKCNVVWQCGLPRPLHLLSTLQLDAFRRGKVLREETDVKGEPGAYLVRASLSLAASEGRQWYLVADVAKDHCSVVELLDFLGGTPNPAAALEEDLAESTARLVALVASADGIQDTADEARTARHFSNNLFNIMRGGLPLAPVTPDNPLPLGFGRRHGDPTRPWNVFNINTVDPLTGAPILDYEGNWRDIFQNWEALAISYPELLGAMVDKFLNCSTADGYNPYRVTRAGFDWETINPKDPWANIGYWGDHQVIYLVRLLESLEAHFPGRLEKALSREDYVFAFLPYRIKSYEDILKDPKHTIEFDADLSDSLKKEMAVRGVEAALLKRSDGSLVKTSFLEKILISLLAKLSNFIPGGGIWMNTQRPEWNDANNALVGGGLSVVTLCYLRRSLAFLRGIVATAVETSFALSEEVYTWMNASLAALRLADVQAVMDALGQAGWAYRQKIYAQSFSGSKESVSRGALLSFFDTAIASVEESIRVNRRDDGLWHAYNLMELRDGRFAGIRHLPEMLEGQVAVLSSGMLGPKEALEVLDALRHSSLWREDQQSYILYPNRALPSFLQKNILPSDALDRSPLLRRMVEEKDVRLVKRDRNGKLHFNGDFRNAGDLTIAMEKAGVAPSERQAILDLFEQTFDHKAFTGRSGTFFAYEGLGSIYWHMVSKLLVAVQECYYDALDSNAPKQEALAAHYHKILEGTGIHKDARQYGAFPTDAYSHTPWGKGAKQPGMTGQVKEDIISRFGELGVRVKDGCVSFRPTLLSPREYRPDGTLEFSYCGARIIYNHKGGDGCMLSREESTRLFCRALPEISVNVK